MPTSYACSPQTRPGMGLGPRRPGTDACRRARPRCGGPPRSNQTFRTIFVSNGTVRKANRCPSTGLIRFSWPWRPPQGRGPDWPVGPVRGVTGPNYLDVTRPAPGGWHAMLCHCHGLSVPMQHAQGPAGRLGQLAPWAANHLPPKEQLGLFPLW